VIFDTFYLQSMKEIDEPTTVELELFRQLVDPDLVFVLVCQE